MIGASELSVKTCCQLWEGSDTRPVLKESDLHFRSEQNQQRIDTLIIQPAGTFIISIPVKRARPTMTKHCCHLPLRIYLVYWLHCRRQGLERGTSNAARRSILVITIFEMCLQGSLPNPVAVVRPTRSNEHKKLRAQAPLNPCASTYRWCTSDVPQAPAPNQPYG